MFYSLCVTSPSKLFLLGPETPKALQSDSTQEPVLFTRMWILSWDPHPTAGSRSRSSYFSKDHFLEAIPSSSFSILLSHQPSVSFSRQFLGQSIPSFCQRIPFSARCCCHSQVFLFHPEQGCSFTFCFNFPQQALLYPDRGESHEKPSSVAHSLQVVKLCVSKNRQQLTNSKHQTLEQQTPSQHSPT